MSRETPKNLAASVNARLLAQARQSKQEFQLLLMQYGLERLMYRLSQSGHGHEFVKELLASKRAKGRSELYLTDLRIRLTRFAKTCKKRPLSEITSEDIDIIHNSDYQSVEECKTAIDR